MVTILQKFLVVGFLKFWRILTSLALGDSIHENYPRAGNFTQNIAWEARICQFSKICTGVVQRDSITWNRLRHYFLEFSYHENRLSCHENCLKCKLPVLRNHKIAGPTPWHDPPTPLVSNVVTKHLGIRRVKV